MRKISTIIWQYKRDFNAWLDSIKVWFWLRGLENTQEEMEVYDALSEEELEAILNDPAVIDTVAENILLKEFKL